MMSFWNESSTSSDLSESTPFFQRLEEGDGAFEEQNTSSKKVEHDAGKKKKFTRVMRRFVLVSCCVVVVMLLMTAVVLFLKKRQFQDAGKATVVQTVVATETEVTQGPGNASTAGVGGAGLLAAVSLVSSVGGTQSGNASGELENASDEDNATNSADSVDQVESETTVVVKHSPETATAIVEELVDGASGISGCKGWYKAEGLFKYFILISDHLQEKSTARMARAREHGRKMYYEERFRCETTTNATRVNSKGDALSKIGEYRPLTDAEVRDLPKDIVETLVSVESAKRTSQWYAALAHYNDGAVAVEDGSMYWQSNPSPVTGTLGEEQKTGFIDAYVADLTPQSGVQKLAAFLKFGTEEKTNYDATSEFCNTIRGSHSGGWNWWFTRQYKSMQGFLGKKEHAEIDNSNVDENGLPQSVAEMSLFKAAFRSGQASEEASRIRFYQDARVLPIDLDQGVPRHQDSCASQDFLRSRALSGKLSYSVFITEYQAKEVEITEEVKGMTKRLLKGKVALDSEDFDRLPNRIRPPVSTRSIMICSAVSASSHSGCENSDDSSSCLACTEMSYGLRSENIGGSDLKKGGLLVEEEIGRRSTMFEPVKRIIKIADKVTCGELNAAWNTLPKSDVQEIVGQEADREESVTGATPTPSPRHKFADAESWNPMSHNGDTFVKVFSHSVSTIVNAEDAGVGQKAFQSLKNCVKA
jgi:hypothetical protein